MPTYNPTVVYGAWPYPAYPPYYYYPPGYAAGAAFFSFSVGVVVGGAIWGNCNWGGSDVDIDVNRYNNFNRNEINHNRNTNINNRGNNNTGKWQHDTGHRQGVGYRDTATQQKYGRGASQQGMQGREEYRGRSDAGGGSQYRDLGGGQSGNDRSASSSRRGRACRSTGVTIRQRRTAISTAHPAISAASRDSASRSRSSDAFNGVGNGASTRAQQQSRRRVARRRRAAAEAARSLLGRYAARVLREDQLDPAIRLPSGSRIVARDRCAFTLADRADLGS